jgi:hypothetical protein
MHGPKSTYAVNGHPRHYTATNDGEYIGGFNIGCNSIVGKVAGVHVEFPRKTASAVLRTWREKSYTVSLEYNHHAEDFSICGPDECTMCLGTDVRIIPDRAFA